MNKKLVALLFCIAVTLAIFEIQIEGRTGGWGKHLPCWRAESGSVLQSGYGAVMNDKPLDGFHLSEVCLLILFFHLPFAYGMKWKWSKEAETMANFLVMSVCWDFTWFMLNPAFGWSRFDAQHIWWHIYWIGLFPKDYYGGFLFATILALLAGRLEGKGKIREVSWPIAKNLLGVLGLTLFTAIVAELVRAFKSDHYIIVYVIIFIICFLIIVQMVFLILASRLPYGSPPYIPGNIDFSDQLKPGEKPSHVEPHEINPGGGDEL